MYIAGNENKNKININIIMNLRVSKYAFIPNPISNILIVISYLISRKGLPLVSRQS
jgi:hypothetical protein